MRQPLCFGPSSFPCEFADGTWVRFIGIFACLALVTASSAATLSNPRRVGTGFEFSIVAASNAIYAIEASSDLQNWTRVATNRQFGELRTISIPASAQQEFYRVRPLRPLFTAALGVRESLRLAGSGVPWTASTRVIRITASRTAALIQQR